MKNQNNYRAAFAYAINFHMQAEISPDVLTSATVDNLAYLVHEFSSMYEAELPDGVDADLIKQAWEYWAEYNKALCADVDCDYDELVAAIRAL